MTMTWRDDLVVTILMVPFFVPFSSMPFLRWFEENRSTSFVWSSKNASMMDHSDSADKHWQRTIKVSFNNCTVILRRHSFFQIAFSMVPFRLMHLIMAFHFPKSLVTEMRVWMSPSRKQLPWKLESRHHDLRWNKVGQTRKRQSNTVYFWLCVGSSNVPLWFRIHNLSRMNLAQNQNLSDEDRSNLRRSFSPQQNIQQCNRWRQEVRLMFD